MYQEKRMKRARVIVRLSALLTRAHISNIETMEGKQVMNDEMGVGVFPFSLIFLKGGMG